MLMLHHREWKNFIAIFFVSSPHMLRFVSFYWWILLKWCHCFEFEVLFLLWIIFESHSSVLFFIFDKLLKEFRNDCSSFNFFWSTFWCVFYGTFFIVYVFFFKDVNLWKDSLNILKLVVSNSSQIQQVSATHVGITSSQLVQPRGSIGSLLTLAPKLPWGTNLAIGENPFSLSSQMFKKELPGRTLEFTYNVESTPVIGSKYNDIKEDGDHSYQVCGTSAPCWRKPHGSQVCYSSDSVVILHV